MVVERDTQKPLVVANGELIIEDGRDTFKLSNVKIMSITPEYANDSLTFTTDTDDGSVYTVFRTKSNGDAIEPDATLDDYAIRIALLIEA